MPRIGKYPTIDKPNKVRGSEVSGVALGVHVSVVASDTARTPEAVDRYRDALALGDRYREAAAGKGAE